MVQSVPPNAHEFLSRRSHGRTPLCSYDSNRGSKHIRPAQWPALVAMPVEVEEHLMEDMGDIVHGCDRPLCRLKRPARLCLQAPLKRAFPVVAVTSFTPAEAGCKPKLPKPYGSSRLQTRSQVGLRDAEEHCERASHATMPPQQPNDQSQPPGRRLRQRSTRGNRCGGPGRLPRLSGAIGNGTSSGNRPGSSCAWCWTTCPVPAPVCRNSSCRNRHRRAQ